MSEILQDFSESSLKTAIEANLFEHMLLFHHWDQAEIHNDPDMIWSITNIPFPRFNSILRAQISPGFIDATIEEAIKRCRSKKVPLLWWTGPATQPADLDKYLMAYGFTHKGDQPGMAADLYLLREDPPMPSGLVIKQVTDKKTLQKWCDVFGAGFRLPGFARDAFFDFNSDIGFNSRMPLRNYIGWLNDEPIATSTLVLGAGVAGIYNVATVPDARRKGVGYAMTLRPLQEARAKGYRVGVLYASEMGANVYIKMGFKEYCKIGQYLWESESGNHSTD
jgi:GNAT superfamily N-acetyltransferase